MRNYEIVYIFAPSLDEAGVNGKLERYHELLMQGGDGAEVTAVDHWGGRQLAYPIDDQTTGYYVVVHATAATEALPEFERLLKLDEELLRYLVVVNEGDLATRPVEPEPEGEGDDEDGDDDDDSDED